MGVRIWSLLYVWGLCDSPKEHVTLAPYIPEQTSGPHDCKMTDAYENWQYIYNYPNQNNQTTAYPGR